MRVMTRLLDPGSVAYDVGANYGMHTLLMARLVGSTGRVFAFEPVPEIFAALSGNIKLNNFGNTSAVQVAVADRAGSFGFETTQSTATGHLSDSEAHVVQTTTLDDFVLESGNPAPTFIKIDVEGAETRVLEGGMRVLRQFRPDLLIELHTPEQDRGVGRILRELDYHVTRPTTGESVANLDTGWPDPNGVWGTVLARG
jgi:FkbM family methyltransferase